MFTKYVRENSTRLARWGRAIKSRKKVIGIGLNASALIVAIFLWYTTQEQVRLSEEGLWRTDSVFAYQRKRDILNDSTTRGYSDSSIALSKRIAATQEQFAKIETRAYIVAEPVDMIRKSKDTLLIKWNITNVGKTPAYKTRMVKRKWLEPPSITEQRNVILPSISETIGAGRSQPNHAIVVSLPEVLDSIINETKSFFFTLKVGYVDQFGEHHVTYAHGRLYTGHFSTMPTPKDE